MKEGDPKMHVLLNEEKQRKLCLIIVAIVGEYYKMEAGYNLKTYRDFELVRAKHMCMYLVKTNTRFPYADLCNLFSVTNHSTVIHGVKRIKHELAYNIEIKAAFQVMQGQINDEIANLINDTSNETRKVCAINLNEFTSIKFGPTQFLIASGFTDSEITGLLALFRNKESKTHKDTGLFLLEDIANTKGLL